MIDAIRRLFDERPGTLIAVFFGVLFTCQIVFFAIAFSHPPQLVGPTTQVSTPEP